MRRLAATMIFFLFMNFCGIISAQEPRNGVDVMSQFYSAGQSYREGDYAKAIELYEGIVKSGKVSAAIYYNLGNSYFKAGQLGKAIVNYERARRLAPRDNDIQSNYDYALSLVKNYEGASRESAFIRVFFQYGDFWILDEVTVLLFILFMLAGAIYLAGLWLRWPPGSSTGAVVTICVLFIIHACVFSFKLRHEGGLAVVVADTSAKFEPREEATNYFELAQGWKAVILREEGPWVKIQRKDGKVGWVKKADLERI